ncbi:MAG: hypothetical protein K0S34_71 [Bacillales bacterium]|jgi:hypothetical protein|nr:hypothetical protein [Bacillales bacterium]
MKFSAELVKSMFNDYLEGKVTVHQLAAGYRHIFDNNLYANDETIEAMLECSEQLLWSVN